MWPKSIAAIIWGLLLSITLMLNLHQLSPFTIQVNLLVGVLLAFVIWAGVMVYCHSCNTVWRSSRVCLMVFVPSALFNAINMLL